jgi:hypothetical protein
MTADTLQTIGEKVSQYSFLSIQKIYHKHVILLLMCILYIRKCPTTPVCK